MLVLHSRRILFHIDSQYTGMKALQGHSPIPERLLLAALEVGDVQSLFCAGKIPLDRAMVS